MCRDPGPKQSPRLPLCAAHAGTTPDRAPHLPAAGRARQCSEAMVHPRLAEPRGAAGTNPARLEEVRSAGHGAAPACGMRMRMGTVPLPGQPQHERGRAHCCCMEGWLGWVTAPQPAAGCRDSLCRQGWGCRPR